jgi:4-hydroxy-3-polyprenylbenzoate decarboxylase
MTGASGADYGLRLLQCLLDRGQPVQLLLSKAAQIVISMETDLHLPGRPRDIQRVLTEHYRCASGLLRVYGQDEWTAPPASGSALAQAMVVCPCTTGALAAIANGNSDNLLERAADVSLKEGRPLILAVRETPLSVIHLENMLRLARTGAIILPTNPGFYHRPATVAELVDFIVARILDRLHIPHTLLPRWGEESDPEALAS